MTENNNLHTDPVQRVLTELGWKQMGSGVLWSPPYDHQLYLRKYEALQRVFEERNIEIDQVRGIDVAVDIILGDLRAERSKVCQECNNRLDVTDILDRGIRHVAEMCEQGESQESIGDHVSYIMKQLESRGQ